VHLQIERKYGSVSLEVMLADLKCISRQSSRNRRIEACALVGRGLTVTGRREESSLGS